MQASKVAPPQLSTDQKPTWSSFAAIGNMSSRRMRVARMDWWASRSTTSVMPSGCFATVMEGTPFPESTAARAVLMNRGLDGSKNIRIRLGCDRLRGRRLRNRLADEAAGQVGHQANTKDQQNEEGVDETYAEQHEFDTFKQELAGGHRDSLVSSSSCLLFAALVRTCFATRETAEQ